MINSVKRKKPAKKRKVLTNAVNQKKGEKIKKEIWGFGGKFNRNSGQTYKSGQVKKMENVRVKNVDVEIPSRKMLPPFQNS